MTDPIISLCYISDIRDNSLVLLDRIADFCDDHFEAYQPVAVSNIGSDRNRIIGFTNRINAPEGSIGVYEWYAFEDGERWKTDIHPFSLSWTEVIPTNYASPKEIIASLRQGWKYAHALDQQDFIVCCKQTGSVLLGVRFPADSISHDGNMCTIADDVIQVEVGTIRTSDLFSLSAQKRYILLDTKRWVKSKDEFVMSIDEIISKIAGGLIGKIDKSALTRKERQAARSALSKLSAQTI